MNETTGDCDHIGTDSRHFTVNNLFSISQINGEELVGEKDTELQKDCVRRLRQADGDIDLLLSRERADSYSDDLALTHDEDEHITGSVDDGQAYLSTYITLIIITL